MKEKSQAEMNAAKRQAELIGEALGNAADNNQVWLNAEGKQSYKKHLAATLFADVLKQGVSHERTASEQNKVETEVKQEESHSRGMKR